MRYTEARLATISDLMLADIEKDTIDWNDNFDTTLKEPGILPAALPNLLINAPTASPWAWQPISHPTISPKSSTPPSI